jgi:flavin reductase (DIM6/NTAB) family NADH-FMN oxidoreductase RutF
MEKLSNDAITKIGYGLYVLIAREGEKDNGCIVNVVAQLTSSPMQMMISVNKQNLTHDMILRTGRFNVCCLTEHTPMKVFEHFGFQSGRDVNKFEGCDVEMRSSNGLLYLPKYTNAYLSGQMNYAKDLGTHTLFIADITEAVHLSDDPSLTYAYYQQHIKPKPVAAAQPSAGGKKKWVCEVCGYVYEGDELPADFICPWCKHPSSDFKLVE